MTVVIADSSPLNYLTLIGSVDVLHRLYEVVVVPRQVISELIDSAAPQQVRTWASIFLIGLMCVKPLSVTVR
jgi:predicted nucleic acid-binding protein